MAILTALFASIAFAYPQWVKLDPNLEHAPFVLAASCWMAWRARTQRVSTGTRTSAAVPAVALGVVLELGSWFAGIGALEVVALILTLIGALGAIGGGGKTRRFAFPIAFLAFTAPLPALIYQPLALMLQAWVCGLSAWCLQLFGVAVFREGSVLHLAGHALDIGAACAGVRQATAFLALTLAAGYLSGRAWPYRVSLAMLTLPIALTANVTRVLVTAAIVLGFGPSWVEGTWHELEGATLVVLGAALVLLAAVGLARLKGPCFATQSTTRCQSSSGAVDDSPRWRPVMAALLLGLVIKGVVAWHVAGDVSVTKTVLQRPLSALPNELDDWRATDIPISDPGGVGEQRVRRRYENMRTGQHVVVALDYSPRSEDRSHHPEVCMAVAGLTEDRPKRCLVALRGNAGQAQQFRFIGRDGGQAVYYWHYTFSSTRSADTDALQRLYQRLHVPPASVTVEVFAPESAGWEPRAVPTVVGRIDGALQSHLPPGATLGCERRPVFLVNGPFAGAWR